MKTVREIVDTWFTVVNDEDDGWGVRTTMPGSCSETLLCDDEEAAMEQREYSVDLFSEEIEDIVKAAVTPLQNEIKRFKAHGTVLSPEYAELAKKAMELELQLYKLQHRIERAEQVAAFFSSVIKSGKPWTDACETALHQIGE